MILIFLSLIFVLIISKLSVLTSQGAKYFYSYYRFSFVIPILVICDREMNMQSVPRVPKYEKCATSTETYKECHEHQNTQSVPPAPKYTKRAKNTKICKVCHEHQSVENHTVSVCHTTLNALMSRLSQPKFNEPGLFGEDSR